MGGQRFVSMFVCTPGSVLFCEAPHSFLFIYLFFTKWNQIILIAVHNGMLPANAIRE